MLRWDFMKNALLAILLMAPLFGLLSTMIVTGRMSFFSDALGHSAFTGIAIGAICGIAAPIWAAVIFSVVFALLFSWVRSRSNQAADTLIGVFSSTAVALGIFVATLGVGYWSGVEELRQLRTTDDIFTRKMATEQVEGYLNGWKDAVRRTL
jgi:zinc transport system permease protein